MPSRALQLTAVLPLALTLVGCEDASLRRLQQRAAVDLIEATAIGENLERFEEEDSRLRARLAPLDGWFDAAGRPGALLATLRGLGVADGRADPLGGPGVLVHAAPGPEQALALAERFLRSGQPVLLSALRCAADGCTATLSPPRRLVLPDRGASPTLADLPPRPWWPPEAGRWDRTRDDLVRLEAARAAVGPLMGIRRRQEEFQALAEAVDAAWRQSELTTGVALDALAAGASDVDARAFEHPDGRSVRVVAEGAGPALADALGRRGRVTVSGQAYLVTVEHLGAALARQRRQR